jgi:3'-5' exoribonuclease
MPFVPDNLFDRTTPRPAMPTAAPSPRSPANETPARRFVAELTPNERFGGPFTISNAQLGTTRNGKPYLRCLLSDSSGELPARMWSIPDEVFKSLPTNGFVYAEGETQPFQGELQLILHRIEPHEPTDTELRDLIPASKRDPVEMFDEVARLLGTLEHPAIRALAETYLADEMLMQQFRIAPAAQSLHHAWLGGLLEHTLTLLRVADAVLPIYPKVNRDLVMLGLFLHDLGKTRELSYESGFGYSDRGELIGHIVEGAIMLHDKAQQMMQAAGLRLPPHALTVLQHIILSHHGVPEYGAAKIPATPEAIMVSILDNLDAKMAMALGAARPDRARATELGGNFTERHWALGAKIFRPDPLA